MDTALFLTLFLFAVQTAAGVAPIRWGHRWLADAIFYVSGFLAIICLISYLILNRDWLMPNIQPSYVIAFGITVALGGLLWQWKQTPPPDPQIAILTGRIEDLQKRITTQQVTPRPATAAPAQTPPKISTAPADVPKKLAAIDALRAILENDMVPLINMGQQLTSGAWWNWGVGGDIEQLKNQMRKLWELGKEVHEKLERLQKDNVQFPDIHALASSPLGTPYLLKMEKIVTPVLALPDGRLPMSNELYRFLFEPPAKEAYETVNGIESWRRTTDQNALQLRKQISQ